MTGRNDNGILVNNTSSQQAKLFVNAYRRDFNYPAWFENTLGFAESGQINVQELQRAADNLLNQGLMTVKRGVGEMTPSDRKRETEKILQNYYGDDINLLHGNVEMLGTTMTESFDLAQAGREANQANITSNTGKIENLITEQQNIYDSIGQKADKSHSHGGGSIFDNLKTYALVGGVGILAFFLLKKRIGL
tara:strand:+ start:655 stop:1230 length:576 start_codon:yes stop_codon:yes gene_type:complete